MLVLFQATTADPNKYMAYAFMFLTLATLVGFAALKITTFAGKIIEGRGSQAAAPASQVQEKQEPLDNYSQPFQPPQFTSLRNNVQAPLVTSLAPEQRHNVIIAAAPGDGKTVAINSMLVADLARGVQAIVCNPHFTYYNEEDQPIDLRPLAGRFEVATEYKDIHDTFKNLLTLITKERKPRYQDNLPLGHTIVVYIDEAPAITGEATNPEYAKACQQMIGALVFEGRKYKVFVVFAAQNGQVGTIKLSGGIRSCFATRLVGNVDTYSWGELIGKETPQPIVKQGTWYVGGKMAVGTTMQLIPASASDVQAVASGTSASQPVQVSQAQEPIKQADDASTLAPRQPHERAQELEAMAGWLELRDDQGKPLSGREMARRLYKLRGGMRDEYKGDGPLYYQMIEIKDTVVKNID